MDEKLTERVTDPAVMENTDKIKSGRKIPRWIIIVICLLCAAGMLVLGAYIAFRISDNYIWDNYSVTVSQQYYDGTVRKTNTLVNEPVILEEPEPVEGKVFLGWENEQGVVLCPCEIAAAKTETYKARYIVDLDRSNRNAYIFPDENGLYRLDDDTTRGDAAIMIYTVLAEHVEPSEYFTDVSEDADCYEAVSELKTIGVSRGVKYYPDDYLTLGELIQMLSCFYPVSDTDDALQYLGNESEYYGAFVLAEEQGWLKAAGITEPEPYAPVSRAETIMIINAALGRSSDCDIPDTCATGILEYRPGDSMFFPLAQAAVGHTYTISNDKEIWLTSECSAEHEEGRYFIGNEFYYVDADGHFARDAEINGFKFGPDGLYTSGDPELDAMVQEVIDKYYTPELTREELLRKLFDFTVNSFQYKRRTFYTPGDRSYAPEAAKIMLSERTGNCYNYAATFCMLARAIGYDAYVCSGDVGKNMDRHGWCEILVDGVPYICDAELMMKIPRADLYMKTYQELSLWYYLEDKTYHR